MFVPSVMGAPLLWAGASPVLVYNLLIIAGFALSGWAMYLLMRRWTGSEWAGDHRGPGLRVQRARADALRAPAGAARRVLSADALRARSRARSNGGRRDAVLLAAAFVLQALCSNYLLVFTTYALVVAVAVALAGDRHDQQAVRSCSIAGVISVVVARAVPVAVLPGRSRSAAWRARQRCRDAVQRRLARLPRHRRPPALRVVEPPVLRRANGALPGLHRARASRRSARVRRGSAIARSARAHGARDRRARRRVVVRHVAAGLSRSSTSTCRCLSGLRNVARWGWLPLAAIAILAGFGVAALERTHGYVAATGARSSRSRCS